MAVYVNGVEIGQPYLNGRLMNALYNGRKLWATPADTVTGVEILASDGSPAPTVLSIGGSVKLAARATYADGHESDLLTSEHVFFESLDDSVATVSGNRVTWKHGGTALITAKVGGFTSAAVSIASAYAPESIKVTDDSGKTIDNITLRVGEDINLHFSVLPVGASQEVTATIGNKTIAVLGAVMPRGMTVLDENGNTVESLTLRVGETQALNVNILPSDAPQDYTATVAETTIATTTKE